MFEAQKPWYEVTKGISSLRFVTNGGDNIVTDA